MPLLQSGRTSALARLSSGLYRSRGLQIELRQGGKAAGRKAWICRKISANRSLAMATSAIWKVM